MQDSQKFQKCLKLILQSSKSDGQRRPPRPSESLKNGIDACVLGHIYQQYSIDLNAYRTL